MALILASKSPRRRELLERLGLEFTVRAADVDETMNPANSPEQEVGALSARKAAAIPSGEDVVVAADTIVVLGDTILGKPKDAADAVRMLKLLGGKTHQVMTGVTVQRGEKRETFVEKTDVTFRPLSETEIRAYVATGDPLDKAGAYGVQGMAGAFVSHLGGDFFNVMGLPICRLCPVLRRFGVTVLGE